MVSLYFKNINKRSYRFYVHLLIYLLQFCNFNSGELVVRGTGVWPLLEVQVIFIGFKTVHAYPHVVNAACYFFYKQMVLIFCFQYIDKRICIITKESSSSPSEIIVGDEQYALPLRDHKHGDADEIENEDEIHHDGCFKDVEYLIEEVDNDEQVLPVQDRNISSGSDEVDKFGNEQLRLEAIRKNLYLKLNQLNKEKWLTIEKEIAVKVEILKVTKLSIDTQRLLDG